MAKITELNKKLISTATISQPGTFIGVMGSPLDSRIIVETLDDLFNPETYGTEGKYCFIYEGIGVYVRETRSVYVYTGPVDVQDTANGKQNLGTLSDEVKKQTNWVKSVSSGGIDDILPYEEVTHEDLLDLRDESKLVPGRQYRITDYICTTTLTGTKAVENKFDIIVTADTESTLSEIDRATQHEEEDYTYFENNKLEAWQLWYCIDNDKTRFKWVDEENGKGVIYRMIDEYDNDVCYDFKNIQYEIYKVTSDLISEVNNKYLGFENRKTKSIDLTSDKIWRYTFDSNNPTSTDSPIDSSLTTSRNNKVNSWYNVFLATNNKNTVSFSTYNVFFDSEDNVVTHSNTNIISSGNSHLEINTSIAVGCNKINVEESSLSNFVNVENTSVGYGGYGIVMSNSKNNTIGKNCNHLIFGKLSDYTTTENEIVEISKYFVNNNIGDGVSNVCIYPSIETSTTNYICNLNIHRGVYGGKKTDMNDSIMSISPKYPILQIEIDTFNQDYEINISRDKNGLITQWTT